MHCKMFLLGLKGVKMQGRLTNQQFVLNKKLDISAEKNAVSPVPKDIFL